jgi:hypothetical protein
VFFVFALALCAACEEPRAPERRAAPATPRASAILDPPQIRIGDRAALEVAVIAPPGHRVLPFAPPETLPGFEILGAETLGVEREPSRWIHRTRVHLRARDVGSFVWPGGSVGIAPPDGSPSRLTLTPLPLEVVSVLPEYPGRMAPFGARPAPAERGAGLALPSAALGSLVTLAALGLVVLVRRRRGGRTAPAREPAAAAVPPWTAARSDLERARSALPRDPVGSADAAAAAVCRYMAGRFRAEAEARTTEELAVAAPPFAATSRWPVFLALLRELDALRFPRQPTGAPNPALEADVAALLRRAGTARRSPARWRRRAAPRAANPAARA